MRFSIYYHHIIICMLIAITTIFVYWNIYHIPFLYTENFLFKRYYIQDLGLFFEYLNSLNWKMLLAKPLVNLTFAINYAIGAKNPMSYHLVNLIIHLINVFLIYIIAQRFFKLPWLCASLFALHPLGTACVSQIFGRTYSLGTLFMLIALYIYFSAWQQQRVKITTYAILFALFVCMLLSKQSMVFFPFIIIWYIICFSDVTRLFQSLRTSNLKWILLASIVMIGVTLFFSAFYAAPLSATAAVNAKTYLLSQIGNIPQLIALYFLPFQTALRHDLPFYAHISSPHVLMGIFYLLIYIALMLRLRRSTVGFLMGAFLLSLLPTNSIFPKDEVILEWRLYPSLVFFSLLMGNIVYLACQTYTAYVKKNVRVIACAGIMCYVFYLSSFGWSIWQQNKIYHSNISAWEQVLSYYPYSANAITNLGIIYYDQGDYVNAELFFKKATQMNPTSCIYLLNLAKTYQNMGKIELGEDLYQQALRLKKQYGAPTVTIYMRD